MTVNQPPMAWRKSRRCDSAACVEVAPISGGMAMRDSEHPDEPFLWFSSDAWSDFLAGIRAGDFN